MIGITVGFACGVLVAVLGWALIEARTADNWKR